MKILLLIIFLLAVSCSNYKGVDRKTGIHYWKISNLNPYETIK